MRRFGFIVLLALILILVLLLVLPNLKGCSSNSSVEESSSITSLIARYVTGESNDGLCDFCGAPSTTTKRGYEVCDDCYGQAVSYYKKNY